MNRSDALKILHIEENELKPEQVMQVCFDYLFKELLEIIP
jgi:hypothetical protein